MGVRHTRANKHLLNLVAKDLLHTLGQRLELSLHLLDLLLLILVIDVETLLGGGLQLIAIELLQLLNSILIVRTQG